MGPFASTDGHNFPRLIDEPVPGVRDEERVRLGTIQAALPRLWQADYKPIQGADLASRGGTDLTAVVICCFASATETRLHPIV